MKAALWDSTAAVLVAALVLPMGCATEASLVRETPAGGIVAYTINNEGDILTAPGRSEALEIIRHKCPHGSRIVREGSMAKVRADVDRKWRDQIGTDSRWALQFQCQ